MTHLPEAKATGVVSRIDPAGTINQGVVYYKTRIDLDPTTEPLLIDMTANPRIIIDTHADVLAVPGGAMRSDPQGGYYVNVMDADWYRAARRRDDRFHRWRSDGSGR